MKIWLKNFLFILFALILISSLFSLSEQDYFKEIEKVSLTTVVEQIKQDQIEKINIQGNKLEIELTDGTQEEASKETNTSLTNTLKNFGVSEKDLQGVDITEEQPSDLLVFMTNVLPILLPILLIGFFIWFMLKQAKRGQSQVFTFGSSKARLFHGRKDKKDVSFDEVGGLKEVKTELNELVDFLKKPKKFLKMGAKIPRGVLLVGPPGSGKTLVARAVANEAGVPFFTISGSEFVEMFVGVGAARVRDTFKIAKKQSPAILFIDELDAIGRHRGAGLGGGHDEREQTLNQILVEMDGFDKQTNVIVMAATNRPDILDPALLRPGRFDRRIVLENPDIQSREKILSIHAKDKPLAKGVQLKIVAERTPGFSGADLENLLNEAAILAARNNKKTINQNDLFDSIEKVLLGPARESRILSKKEKKISAYHEAGHALVAAKLPNTDPIHKISIVSRGMAGGYTLKLPTEDKNFHAKSEFISDLSVLLGGYTAEKLIFKEVTTGASSDLQRATDLARSLITRYGMSESLGPVTFGKRQELVFLGKEIHEDRNYSEEIAAKIDEEISNFIQEAYNKAEKVLKNNKKLLEKIAQRLIKKESIEREEFEELIGRKKKIISRKAKGKK
jgi:cell division protease FtsH